MRADYDSNANAISISIADVPHAGRSDEVHSRAIVAIADGKAVEVQLLYPDMGIASPWKPLPIAMASTARRCTLPRSPRLRRLTASWCSRSRREHRHN